MADDRNADELWNKFMKTGSLHCYTKYCQAKREEIRERNKNIPRGNTPG